jgi:hypothetical protein
MSATIEDDNYLDVGTPLSSSPPPKVDPLGAYEDTLTRIVERMLTAINEEEKEDLQQHIEVLNYTKSELMAQGKLLTNLKIEVESCDYEDIINVEFAGGGRLPSNHQFKTRQTVTLLEPNEADGGTRSSSKKGTPSGCSTATARKEAILENSLARLGFTKAFNAVIIGVYDSKIVIQTRVSSAYKWIKNKEVIEPLGLRSFPTKEASSIASFFLPAVMVSHIPACFFIFVCSCFSELRHVGPCGRPRGRDLQATETSS